MLPLLQLYKQEKIMTISQEKDFQDRGNIIGNFTGKTYIYLMNCLFFIELKHWKLSSVLRLDMSGLLSVIKAMNYLSKLHDNHFDLLSVKGLFLLK